ncbi:SGNH/GDSL hydrolase family protein [Bacillus sp. SRB1LM]|nr:SGNH/GDSL hydrolase family protein [Bacillus sp. SRB1LM]
MQLRFLIVTDFLYGKETIFMKKIIFLITIALISLSIFAISRIALQEEQYSSPSKNTVQSKSNTHKSKSIIDFLKQTSATKGNVKIVALGDSVTFGVGAITKKGSRFSNAWGGLLKEYLNTELDIPNLQVINKGFPYRSTSDLIKEKRIEEVIHEQADLVIFEVCLFNNQSQGISLNQTALDIDTIVTEIHKNSPNTLVLLQSPNPSTSRSENKTNRIGLTYQDYLNHTKKHIKEKGWHYIDTYSAYQNFLIQKNLQLKETLNIDGIHPNNTGYMIWFEILKAEFSKPLN